MITADQLLAHAVGDYLLQSQWMADEKTRDSFAAACHAVAYSAPFLRLRPSTKAIAAIMGTHFLVDRFRLARHATWVKNGPWKPRTATGYSDAVPPWLAVWLLIIADNVMHVAVNGIALRARDQ